MIPIWFRWARPDPELLSFSANVVAIITLVSLLGLQTKWGADVAQALWEKLSSRQPLLQDIRTGFVLSLLLASSAIAGFYIGLPAFARYHNERGLKAQEQGHFSMAAEAFRQAVSLAPGKASYRFNVGNAYERLGDMEQAVTEYQRALELDDCLWPAYSSLGLLYLTDRNSPDAALTLLLAGLERTAQPCRQNLYSPSEQLLAEGVIHKNLGWAYLQRGLPQSALDELDKADVAFTQYESNSDNPGSVLIYRVEALRLQALAHEALQDEEEAIRSWASSEGIARAIVASATCQEVSSLANVYCLNAQIWANEALERLNSQ
jgi:tetratricopeptide (TPR) repeat protein